MTNQNPRLFHISENGTIDTFYPRKSKQMWGYKQYVWAISENKIHNYLFPRACPRICVGKDLIIPLKRWIDQINAIDKKGLIFLPESWKKKVESSLLFRYEFNTNNFHIIDTTAGYYVSEYPENPRNVMPVNNCLELLTSMKVGVYFKNHVELSEIYDFITGTTDNFSIIKWDNLN